MEENNIQSRFAKEERRLKYETMLEERDLYISVRRLCDLIRYLIIIPLVSSIVLLILFLVYFITKFFLI